jgi:hypothetical protein
LDPLQSLGDEVIFIWYLSDAVMHGTGTCIDPALAQVLSEGKDFFGDGCDYGHGHGNGDVSGAGETFASGYSLARSGECYGYGYAYDNGNSFRCTF